MDHPGPLAGATRIKPHVATSMLILSAKIYAHVSTAGNQSVEMQLWELRKNCQRRGWDIVGEHVDAGASGVKKFPARTESPRG